MTPAELEQAIALVEDFRPRISKIVMNADDVEDVIQTVYVKLLEDDTYDAKRGPLGGRVFAFCKQAAIDVVNARKVLVARGKTPDRKPGDKPKKALVLPLPGSRYGGDAEAADAIRTSDRKQHGQHLRQSDSAESLAPSDDALEIKGYRWEDVAAVIPLLQEKHRRTLEAFLEHNGSKTDAAEASGVTFHCFFYRFDQARSALLEILTSQAPDAPSPEAPALDDERAA